MAERKATNKYYPPDWEPKKGSLNAFMHSHPLRERARKLKTEGILIVRFEMPYNTWCLHCNEHIGKGVRYNAEKKRIGNYLSTPIFQFRMKCANCKGWMEIHTDPQNHDFKFVSGVQPRTEAPDADSERDRGVMILKTDAEAAKMLDPLYRLEHAVEDQMVAEAEAPKLEKLIELKSRDMNDYALNSALRKGMRQRKKNEKEEAMRKLLPHTDALHAFGRPVVSLNESDRLQVQQQRFAPRHHDFATERTKRRLAIASQPILPSTAPLPAASRKEGPGVRSDKVLEVLAKKRKTVPLTL